MCSGLLSRLYIHPKSTLPSQVELFLGFICFNMNTNAVSVRENYGSNFESIQQFQEVFESTMVFTERTL